MIISIDTEKTPDSCSYMYMAKSNMPCLGSSRIGGNISNRITLYMENYSQHYTTWRKTQRNPIKIRDETGLSPF